MNRGIYGMPSRLGGVTYLKANAAAGAPAASKAWYRWRKPKGAKWITFIIMGAGAPGGLGFAGAAASARGGGGGGGSGGIVRATFPAFLVPDELWIQVPKGDNAAVGGRCLVSTRRDTAAASLLLVSGSGDAGIGSTGTALAGGNGGAASSAATLASACFSAWAVSFIANAGQAGANGGAHTGAAGANVSSLVMPNSAGAGGAGVTTTDFAGGTTTASGPVTVNAGGLANGGDGNPGKSSKSPFFNLGGTGGGSNNDGLAGKGGDGKLGSGGGGGGAGLSVAARSKGGDAACWIIAE